MRPIIVTSSDNRKSSPWQNPLGYALSAVIPLGSVLFLSSPLGAEESRSLLPRISLTQRQMETLRESLLTNPDAARAFEPTRKLADKALVETPNPTRRIISEGHLYTNLERKQSLVARRDLFKIEALGYAYGLRGKAEYGDKAKAFVLAWAQTYEPDGSPINETEFTRLMKAYDLTRALFTDRERLKVEQWLLNMVEKQRMSIRPRSASAKNNHHSHRLKFIGHAAFLLPNPELIRWVVTDYRRHLDVNLFHDGTTFDFRQRDALHYHGYDLLPLVELAIVANKNGLDLYGYTTPQGANLDKSIAFLIPYILGEKEHREFVKSKVEFDFRRSAAGDPNIQVGEKWNAKKARTLFDLAGYFNPRFHQVVFPEAERAFSFDRLLATIR